MTRPLPQLHAVTDDRVLAQPDFATRARAIAHSAAVALHLRSGRATGKRLFGFAQTLKDICARSSSLLFVNDRIDIALAVSSEGIHLPASGMPLRAARDLADDDTWIGCSVHGVREAIEAGEKGADYVFLGPIWETASHPDRNPLGPHVIEAVEGVRVIAIGGITAERVRTCMDAGAYGVAVVSALWNNQDSDAAVRAMLLSLAHDPNDDGPR